MGVFLYEIYTTLEVLGVFESLLKKLKIKTLN